MMDEAFFVIICDSGYIYHIDLRKN